MSQMERILFIDKTCRKYKQYITLKDVTEKFEVSERQVKRDIAYMRDRMHAPLVWDHARHAYHYEKEYKDLAFAGQDYILSYVALESILKNKQYLPVYEDNVFTMLESQVPAEYKELSEKIIFQIPVAEKINNQHFEDICNCMKTKKCIEIEYINSKGINSKRIIEVHRLINYASIWYMIAFEENKGLRTFNLSRIKNLKPAEKKYSAHDRKFQEEIKNYVNGSYGIFHGNTTKNVKIKFTDTAAQIVKSQIWHEKQKITERDSEVILEFPAANYTEVLSKILSFGHKAQPLEPAELINLWREEIKKLSEITAF